MKDRPAYLVGVDGTDTARAMTRQSHVSEWEPVCAISALIPGSGLSAVVRGQQIAVFLLSSGDLHAIGNVDPCSGAGVLSRGVVGEVDGARTVASPLYDQRFDLRTGRCIDDPDIAVAVHGVTAVGGTVYVRPGASHLELAAS